MICYKDRWWCPFHETCTNRHECDRPLTADVEAAAMASSLLVQVVTDKPECHSDFTAREHEVRRIDPA